jgi:hypothetical protein
LIGSLTSTVLTLSSAGSLTTETGKTITVVPQVTIKKIVIDQREDVDVKATGWKLTRGCVDVLEGEPDDVPDHVVVDRVDHGRDEADGHPWGGLPHVLDGLELGLQQGLLSAY